MVQRKVMNKLGIHDEAKSESKQLVKHKPSSLDVKNGGTDLKKRKMKKSGSVKRPDFDNLRTPSSRMHVKQPGKPPPTPPKLPSLDGTITTPNYMKSTTSFDARKEKSTVSTKTPQTIRSNSSSLRRVSTSHSKHSLTSGHNNKGTKALARTGTSLKMMRTPSFKPVRAASKRCSPVVLCDNLDVQRATCSSTLKDSKFPNYLTLSPGATEAEGTSAMKVCPYTYCSLNGHRHAPVPPLKRFLTARRRMIKTQRGIKLGCLSPRQVVKPIGDGLKMDGESLNPNGPIISPQVQEEVNDGFFIEIYNMNKDDEKQDVENPSDGPISSQIDSDENFGDQNQDVNSTGIATAADFDDENQEKDSAEEITVKSTENQCNEVDSEASDMDWEKGQDYSVLYVDDKVEYTSKLEKNAELEGGEVEKWKIIQDEFMIELENTITSCFNENLSDGMSQESINEEGLSSDAWSSSDESDSITSYGCLESFDKKCSAPDLVSLEEEPEAVPHKNKNDILSEGNQSIQTKNICDTIENNEAMSNQNHTEAECHLVRGVKAEKARKPETDDNSLSLVFGKGKKLVEDLDDLGGFNPREPNFLPLEPDPEAEKVDLRHQELDERKNAEEWMVDYALRQAVTSLAPARKRKVALLVEAFEKVMPPTKCEKMKHSSGFGHYRPMQACS